MVGGSRWPDLGSGAAVDVRRAVRVLPLVEAKAAKPVKAVRGTSYGPLLLSDTNPAPWSSDRGKRWGMPWVARNDVACGQPDAFSG
jgi:hypothetical protein